ncbi:MAG TPA: ABC transporter ATP-binding protein [Firmicutes bacterium]|nr:ABC transporter ATP-binding protein [Bacillota bacterium]
MRVLEGRGISFRYPGGPPLLRQADIYLKTGECVGLTGPSGCGKSTLCRILAGIIPRSIPGEVTGQVFISGTELSEIPLAALVQLVGIVFQDPDSQLFSPTVEDEIAFGPENLCLPRDELELRICQALETVGMAAYRQAETRTLSLGQKQLIALAAVLALQPKILIADEIFSRLDSTCTLLVQEAIQRQKSQGRAVLLVDHKHENLALVDRIYRLTEGQLREVSP